MRTTTRLKLKKYRTKWGTSELGGGGGGDAGQEHKPPKKKKLSHGLFCARTEKKTDEASKLCI